MITSRGDLIMVETLQNAVAKMTPDLARNIYHSKDLMPPHLRLVMEHPRRAEFQKQRERSVKLVKKVVWKKNALGAMGSRHERWMDGLLLGFLGLPTTRLTIPRSRNSPKLRMLAPRPETMWILLLTGTFLDSPSVGGPGSKSVGDFRTQFLTVGMMFIRILWGSDVIQHNTMTVS